MWRRPIEDLSVYFEVSALESGKVIFSHIPKIKNFTGNYTQRIRLPASWIHATFGVAGIEEGGKKVKFFKDDPMVIIDIGRYKVSVDVMADSNTIKSDTIFNVSEDEPYLIWKPN